MGVSELYIRMAIWCQIRDSTTVAINVNVEINCFGYLVFNSLFSAFRCSRANNISRDGVQAFSFTSLNVKQVKSIKRSGTEAIRTQIRPSKPKREITYIHVTNSQTTKRTNGQSSEQLFPKRWPLSNTIPFFIRIS